MREQNFELLVGGVPYFVKAVPFAFNEETRYRVSFNQSDEHIFTWDSSLGRMTPIDDESGLIPDDLEQAIALRLQSARS